MSGLVIHISWRVLTLMPAFQFEHNDMSVRPVCVGVLAELREVLGEWDTAVWFATPNTWLHQSTPVSLLDSGCGAVLHAARPDRYIARG